MKMEKKKGMSPLFSVRMSESDQITLNKWIEKAEKRIMKEMGDEYRKVTKGEIVFDAIRHGIDMVKGKKAAQKSN